VLVYSSTLAAQRMATTIANGYAFTYGKAWVYRNRNILTAFHFKPTKRDLTGVVAIRGLSRYSPRVASWTGETGQYGSSLRHTFRVPRCGLIARYRSVTYTIYMQAVAPNGEERSAQTYVNVRSCA
jgi:hypothetical protein